MTELLVDWSNGDRSAADALLPLVYEELRRMARVYMRRERPGHTLQPTALIHEAYLRLVGQKLEWKSRAHFYGIAAQMMRRVLLDHAKSRATGKRGGAFVTVALEDSNACSPAPDVLVLAVDKALTELEEVDPRAGRIVELRFFGGFTNEEASEILGSSPATVRRQWAAAKAWLSYELGGFPQVP